MFFGKYDPKKDYVMPPMPDIEGYTKLFFFFITNFFKLFFIVDTTFVWYTFFLFIYLTRFYYVNISFSSFFESNWFNVWFFCLVHYFRHYFMWCTTILWKRFNGDYHNYCFFFFFYFIIFYYFFYYWLLYGFFMIFKVQCLGLLIIYLRITYLPNI